MVQVVDGPCRDELVLDEHLPKVVERSPGYLIAHPKVFAVEWLRVSGRVVDHAALAADRRRLLQLGIVSGLIALAVSITAVLVPV